MIMTATKCLHSSHFVCSAYPPSPSTRPTSILCSPFPSSLRFHQSIMSSLPQSSLAHCLSSVLTNILSISTIIRLSLVTCSQAHRQLFEYALDYIHILLMSLVLDLSILLSLIKCIVHFEMRNMIVNAFKIHITKLG